MHSIYELTPPDKTKRERSKALSRLIRQGFNCPNGHGSFANYMEQTLYHPSLGYYSNPDFALGHQGDFITAPEISPLFAQCIASHIKQVMQVNKLAYILEMGAGTGKFIIDILKELELQHSLPEEYYICERSPVLRDFQKNYIKNTYPEYLSHLTWLEKFPNGYEGVVFANEVLDALPVHCFSLMENNIFERCVNWDENTQHFAWVLQQSDSLLRENITRIKNKYRLPDNYHSEINLWLPNFFSSITHNLNKGVILFADYGYGENEYYHPERLNGSLTCFYKHHQDDNPFVFPGLQDITAHVNFTQVAELAIQSGLDVSGFTSQAAFLLDCGLTTKLAYQEKNLSKVEFFELGQKVKQLIFPTEMGERVKFMALTKNVNQEELLGFQSQDRRREL